MGETLQMSKNTFPKILINACQQELDMQRTEKFHVYLNQKQDNEFAYAMQAQKLWGNLGRKYLETNYGCKAGFPSLPKNTTSQKMLAQKMRKFALQWIRSKNKMYNCSDRKLPYYWDTQSILKLYEEMIVNFREYQKKQRYLEKKNKGKGRQIYELDHGKPYWHFGRIKYIRDENHYHSVAFKANGGQSVRIINSFVIITPRFGRICSYQPMNKFKYRKIQEVRLLRDKDDEYWLEIVYKKMVQRNLSPSILVDKSKQIAFDWNQHLSHAMVDQHGKAYPFPKPLYQRIKNINRTISNLQRELKQIKNSGSKKASQIKRIIRHKKAKIANIVAEWQKQFVHQQLDRGLLLFALEKLSPSSMTIHKNKKKSRKDKNINRSRNILKPASFRKWFENIVTDQGRLLIEVDPYGTTKVCNECGTFNDQVKVGMEEWHCKNEKCIYHKQKIHHRDTNSGKNILDMALHPQQHEKWKRRQKAIEQRKKYPDQAIKIPYEFLQKSTDLITIF